MNDQNSQTPLPQEGQAGQNAQVSSPIGKNGPGIQLPEMNLVNNGNAEYAKGMPQNYVPPNAYPQMPVNYQNPFNQGPQFQPGYPQMAQQNMMMRPGQPMIPGPGQPMGGYGQMGYGQPGFGPRPPMNNQMGAPQMPGAGQGLNQPLLGGGSPNRFGADNRGIPTGEESNGGAYGTVQTSWGDCTGFLATYLPFPCCCFSNPYEIVPEGFSGVIQRFGKFYKLVGPGQHYLNRDVDSLVLVDKREKVLDLKKQAVVSKDNTTFGIDAVVYYRVVNTYKSRYAVVNLQHSIEDLAITTLRNVIGKFTLQEFLQQREEIAELVEHNVQEPAANWGASVHRVLVQDVILPVEARALFSTGALSKKIAEAQVIAAKADVEAARMMKEAADALNTEAALQIRYIDALDSVSKSNNPKMIFFPADYREVGTVNDHLESDVQRLIRQQEYEDE
jgi:erythrocyte band 7 integral membrane protein